MKNVMTYSYDAREFLNFDNDTHKDSSVTQKPELLQYLGYKVFRGFWMTMKKSL